MSDQLSTTNLLLAVMAAVSALEAVLLIGAAIAGFRMYRAVMALAREVEARHVTPVMARVHAVLDDVQAVTATVKDETQRVDRAIHATLSGIDHTATRARTNVRATTASVVGAVRSLGSAIDRIRQARQRANHT